MTGLYLERDKVIVTAVKAPDQKLGASAFWQTRTSRKLSDEDARSCGKNVVGFFRVLLEWADEDDAANSKVDQSQVHGTVYIGLNEPSQ